MRIAFVFARGADRRGRASVTPAILWLIERIVGPPRALVYVLRYHDRARTYPLLGDDA